MNVMKAKCGSLNENSSDRPMGSGIVGGRMSLGVVLDISDALSF